MVCRPGPDYPLLWRLYGGISGGLTDYLVGYSRYRIIHDYPVGYPVNYILKSTRVSVLMRGAKDTPARSSGLRTDIVHRLFGFNFPGEISDYL